MNKQQERLLIVLSRIKESIEDGDVNAEINAKVYSEEFESMLTNLKNDDFFGSEGQCDPRGDMRNGYFSMSKVEGVD